MFHVCEKAQDGKKRAFTGVVGHARLELKYTSDMRWSVQRKILVHRSYSCQQLHEQKLSAQAHSGSSQCVCVRS